ncbi:MAG: hypothetical protein ACTSSH_10275 [Candidatus Heimdallarchaeota archaeon]
METNEEGPRLYSSIEHGIRQSKTIIMLGFAFNSVFFFLAMIFELVYFIGTLGVQTLWVFNFILLAGNVIGIIGMFLLVIGIRKFRVYFTGNLDRHFKKLTIFMIIFAIFNHLVSISVIPLYGNPSYFFHYILGFVEVFFYLIAFVMVSLALNKMKKISGELVKSSPTHSTKFYSFYPTIIFASILPIFMIVNAIIDLVGKSSNAFSIIFSILAVVSYLSLGLGMVEIGIKFNQMNPCEISRLTHQPIDDLDKIVTSSVE